LERGEYTRDQACGSFEGSGKKRILRGQAIYCDDLALKLATKEDGI
jgi:hypothetical protein